jgi:hypothetical protein
MAGFLKAIFRAGGDFMARLPVWFVAVLAGLLVFALLSTEPAFAQGQPPGPGGGERMRKMMEDIQKEVDKATYEAVKKALNEGKSEEEEAKAAGRKAADEEMDKKVDEIIGRMGGGGQLPGGMDPEMIKKMMKERAGEEIDKAIDDAVNRAVREYKSTNWKGIEPREELVDEEKEEAEIKKAIKETTLFEDFKDTNDKDIKKLKLTKPVVIFFYTTDNSTKSGEKKVEKCEKMQEKVLSDKEFVSAIGEFVRFRMDITKLNTPLKRKYKVSSAPTVVFFDCTGKRLWSFTSPKQKAKTLVKKMESFVEKSEAAKEKAEEKKLEEKEKEKEGEKKEEETGKEEEKPKGELGG